MPIMSRPYLKSVPLLLAGLLAGCAGDPSGIERTELESTPATMAAPAAGQTADISATEASELEALLREHVGAAEQAGSYRLPTGGGVAPAGTLLDISEVILNANGTKTIRARFRDHASEEMYEADFEVDASGGAPAIGERRLHKVGDRTL